MRRYRATIALLVVLLGALAAQPAARAAQGANAGGPPDPHVLRVGTSGDYAPFSQRLQPDPDSGGAAPAPPSYYGFDIEVARRFAAERGYRVEFVAFKWPDLSRDLAAGRFDVAMSGVTMRGDRSVVGRFSVPVAATQAVALTWKGAGASVVRQLDRRERRIAVNAGGYLEGVARKTFPSAQIIAMANNEAVRTALLDRWTDAVVTDNLEEKQWTKGAVGVVRIGPLSDDRKAYLVRADREDLALELDAWLLAHERDGSLARLRSGLLRDSGAAPVSAPLPALITAIVERMSMMPLVWAAKQQASLPIQDEAQEQRVLDAGVAAVSAAARAASRPSPDSAQVRTLFAALIEAGKDVQRRVAERKRAPAQQARGRKQDASASAPATAPATSDRARASDATAAAASAATTAASSEEAARAAQAASEAATQIAATPAAAPKRPSPANDPLAAGEEVDAQPQQPAIALFDLETQLRPAIARVTAKLARLLIAIDTPLTSEAVQRPLSAALADYQLRAATVEAMSRSIAALTSATSARGRE